MILLYTALTLAVPLYKQSGSHCDISGDGEITKDDIKTKTTYTQMISCTIYFGITSIGESAFYGCTNLKEITFPDSLISIHEESFRATNLATITIPSSLEMFEVRMTFHSTPFEKFQVSPYNTNYKEYDGCLYNYDLTVILSCPTKKTSIKFAPSVNEIGTFCFFCPGMDILKIPNTITCINDASFVDHGACTKIDFPLDFKMTSFVGRKFQYSNFGEIVIPPSIELISGNCFFYCTLEKFSFKGESNLTSLNGNVFSSCQNLLTIELPKSIQSISQDAFAGCTRLQSVTVEQGSEYYSTSADGSLYRGDHVELVFIPPSATSLTIHKNTKSISNSITQKLTQIPIESVIVDPENQYIKYRGGIFYDKEYTIAEHSMGSIADAIIHYNTTKLANSLFSNIISLKTLRFDENSSCIEIGKQACLSCVSLAVAELPSSVSILGESCFSGSGLVDFVFPKSATNFYSHIMSETKSLNRVTFEEGNRATKITEYMFWKSTIKEIELPNGLTKILAGAFQESELKEIIFPSNVNEIYSSSFQASHIKSITFLEDSLLAKIYSECFNTCPSLAEVKLPPKIHTIEAGSFRMCHQLQKVTFFDNSIITELPSLAFEGCENLNFFEIPLSLRKIDASCFVGCYKLQSIAVKGDYFIFTEGALYDIKKENLYLFPPGLTEGHILEITKSIQTNAFYGDDHLSILDFGHESQLEALGKDTFFGCTQLSKVEVPGSVERIEGGCFRSCSGLKEVRFGVNSKLQTIGESTFSGCNSLETIDFAENATLQRVEASAFSKCSSLLSIKLPSTLSHLGISAFSECTSLSSVIFENNQSSLYEIPSMCFYECRSLKYLTVPNGVNQTGSNSFSNSALIEFDAPDSLRAIGNESFSGCEDLKRLVFRNKNLKLGEGCLKDCSSLEEVYICSETLIEPVNIFKGSSKPVIIGLSQYPLPELDGVRIERIMHRCLIFPTIPFTSPSDLDCCLEIASFALMTTIYDDVDFEGSHYS